MIKAFLPVLLILAACGSDIEHVQSVGSNKADYRRSPCACFQLPLKTPEREDAIRRGLQIEHALG
jgi:hypothetical protein